MGAPKAFFKVRSTWNFDLVAIFEMNPHGTGDFVAGELLACKSLWVPQGTMGGFSARVQFAVVTRTAKSGPPKYCAYPVPGYPVLRRVSDIGTFCV